MPSLSELIAAHEAATAPTPIALPGIELTPRGDAVVMLHRLRLQFERLSPADAEVVGRALMDLVLEAAEALAIP
jgi:hypothetical protein